MYMYLNIIIWADSECSLSTVSSAATDLHPLSSGSPTPDTTMYMYTHTHTYLGPGNAPLAAVNWCRARKATCIWEGTSSLAKSTSKQLGHCSCSSNDCWGKVETSIHVQYCHKSQFSMGILFIRQHSLPSSQSLKEMSSNLQSVEFCVLWPVWQSLHAGMVGSQLHWCLLWWTDWERQLHGHVGEKKL